MNKREKERISRAFAWVQRKLGTKYHLNFEQFNSEKDKDTDAGTLLMLSRTNRDTQDHFGFTVYFDPKNTKKRSFNKLKRDTFHEVIHLISWERRDIFEETLKQVKNLSLRKALEKRFYDADESITYSLERALGPYVITGWDKEEV